MSRSAKEKAEALERRRQETGSRRGDPRAGHGKDKPPRGGRNRGGRGAGRDGGDQD